MKAYATQSIRNVGIAGHGDTGKTQLVSSLLFTAGMTTRLGKVAEGSTVTDWDEQFIMQLRKAGVNAFEEHDVDFFFTMPDAKSSSAVRGQLAANGFHVVGEHANPDGGYSLDMRRRMRLVVPEMQALTVRFNALASEAGGKYDNWAIGTRPAGGTRA